MLEDRRIYVEKLESESPKAYSAFRAYCEMGPNRSLKRLSEKIGKTKSLLSRWSSKYMWVDRALEFDSHIHDKAIERMVDERLEIEREKAEILRKSIKVAEIALEGLESKRLKPMEILKMIDTGIRLEKECMLTLMELEGIKLESEKSGINIIVRYESKDEGVAEEE